MSKETEKKNGIEISIGGSVGRVKLTPPFYGNEDLPEEKQMAVVFKKRNKLFLQQETLEFKDSHMSLDKLKYARAVIHEIINPWTISVDGEKRPIRVEDIFNPDFDELSDIALWCWDMAVKVQSGTDTELKNS